jgi:hypothetical protein
MLFASGADLAEQKKVLGIVPAATRSRGAQDRRSRRRINSCCRSDALCMGAATPSLPF